MKIIKNLAFTAVAAILIWQTPITRAEDPGSNRRRPLCITFEKCFVPDTSPFGGHFEGTVGGESVGTIEFHYISVMPSTSIIRFSGEYRIKTSEYSITAVCAGFVDTSSGKILLNGVVTDGPYLGDRAQVRAQLNATGTCSSGKMTITPVMRK
jgi:hypothetical protein